MVRVRRGGIEVRSFIRDIPGIVVMVACFGLFLWAGVTALGEGSPGGWVALLFALVLVYPLARRLGGSGAILATPAGLTQRVRFSRREVAWDDVTEIVDDLGGHVVMTTRSGSRVEFLTLGLPPVAWGPQLEDWRADPHALAAERVGREVEVLRERVRALSLR
ncbi:hypothetical protein [Phycicoccus avicenniae]|uniref:hypothetical protein n=1 Tax=Phycicoccus avicenniae TaxID=2828860 RepID=UPI003D29C4DC